TVTVTSVADPTASASAQVTLLNPYPTVASTSPAILPIGAGPFTLTINGSGFVAGAQVMFGATVLKSIYISSTKLTASLSPAAFANGTQVPVAVTNPNPGSVSSTGAVMVQVGPTDGPPVIPYNEVARFLEQAAFGPDAGTAAHVQSVGEQA